MRRQFFLAALMAAVSVNLLADDDRWNNRRGSVYGYEGDDRGYDRYGRDRDYDYGRGGYGRRSFGGDPVSSAMRDLEQVYRRARVDSHEADHFRRALRELAEFDQRAARGRFDRGSLDRAIDNMADLAQADQLRPRDRQIIARHMNNLRSFREQGRWR